MNPAHVNCLDNVQSLRVFVAVAENLSFTRASERLLLTQSAVSHAIARLERDLATRLVERHGRTISLTPAGRTLLGECSKVFVALEDARAAVTMTASPGRARMRIGASATACQSIIPEALREFRECFPHCDLSIEPGDGPRVIERLLADAIDLGIIVRPEGKYPLDYHPLFADRLNVIVGTPHAWSSERTLRPSQLSDEKLIHHARSSATFRLIERHYARLRVPLANSIELGEIGAIKELLKLGLGFSLLAGWVCRPELESGVLRSLRLPGPVLRRSWAIATRRNRELTLPEQTFVGLCQAVTKDFSSAN